MRKGRTFSHIHILEKEIHVVCAHHCWAVNKHLHTQSHEGPPLEYMSYDIYCVIFLYMWRDRGTRAEGDEDKVAKMVGITTRVYLIIDIVILLVLIILYLYNTFLGIKIPFLLHLWR